MTFQRQWKEYKRRSNWFWIITFGYLPGVTATGALLKYIYGTNRPVFIAALFWMLGIGIAGWRLTYWKCPRCGNWFFAKWYFVNQLARKCVHCGLKKWADKGEPV